jgi:hypothetical protein
MEVPAPAPPNPVAPARRTRRTDVWTTLFLLLTGSLGVWSLMLIALTVLSMIEPARDADDDVATIKWVGAVTIAVIAVGQAFTMGAAMGKVPKLGLPMRTLMRTHRYVGRVGLALAGVVAFLCWQSSGGPPTSEGILHGALASTGFLAIALKFALLKRRPALAFRLAPWLGTYAAVAFVLVAVAASIGDDLFELDDVDNGNSGPGGDGGDGGDDDRDDEDDNDEDG